MEEITLEVQVRNEVGRTRVKHLRGGSDIPGVLYGGKEDPLSVKVDRRKIEKIMRTHKDQSILFHLNVMEGANKVKDYSAIIKDEQYHPVQENLIHLDFQRISLKEEITVDVPIVLKGEAIGVVKEGGSLDQPMRQLDIVCLPTNIPERLEVDVTNLKLGAAIHVKELVFPQGVRTKHNPETVVVSVVRAMSSVVEAPAADAPKEPEVLKEKKKVDAPAEGAKTDKAS